MAELLKHDMPARIYPPGTVTAYSNYGTTLAAFIVEQVSGEPYDRYIQVHILNPLAMQHTTIRNRRRRTWLSMCRKDTGDRKDGGRKRASSTCRGRLPAQ